MDDSTLALRRLQTAIVLDLQRIGHAADQRLAELLAASALEPITPAQANALMALVNARRPLTGAELARHLGRSEVTVGRFLRALEAGGWVARERDADDSRRILVRPTAQTREALPRFVKVSNALLDRVFEGMSPQEVRSLGERLSAVGDRLS